jgi:CubicO group peptidase (beta-lactamase class C family)
MNYNACIEEGFRGCVLVNREGERVYEQAFGFADYANERKNTLDTKFPTASAGKVFVAVAILQLIETGKLSFTDTLGELIPMDWKAIDIEITVKELLTHTSGIPDYFDESVMEDYDALWIDYPNYKIRRSSDLLPLFIDKPMMYPRGERFQYNNTGFVVLGMIIEAVTGQLFDDYLKENIFRPAGMLDTGYYELDRLPAKCANAYIYDEERGDYYTNIYSVDVKGTGAGGAFTTVYDIEKFWKYLMTGKFISLDMVNEMTNIQAGDEEDNYGYGIWIGKTEDGRCVPFFMGCDPGVSFVTSYDRTTKTCIIAVSNYEDDVWKIRRNLANL